MRKHPTRDSDEIEQCPTCSAEVQSNERFCPSCGHDLGFPNVRAADSDTERNELNKRFAKVRAKFTSKDARKSFDECAKYLLEKSGVVVSVPATVARGLVFDPKSIYANYDSLVGNTRRPALPTDDRMRRRVQDSLFGVNASEIRYGALSLNGLGLETYGDVHCKLRDVTVRDRTSFLYENSFVFYKKHSLGEVAEIPLGFSAVWHNRNKLALIKISDKIDGQTKPPNLKSMLIVSDGRDRSKDEFIEAHIFGSFNSAAIEKMSLAKKTLSGTSKLDAKLAIHEFNKRLKT